MQLSVMGYVIPGFSTRQVEGLKDNCVILEEIVYSVVGKIQLDLEPGDFIAIWV